MLKMRSYVFQTTQSDYLKYNGTHVDIIRPLNEQEADIADVGRMYKVRFCDGFIGDAFEDELT